MKAFSPNKEVLDVKIIRQPKKKPSVFIANKEKNLLEEDTSPENGVSVTENNGVQAPKRPVFRANKEKLPLEEEKTHNLVQKKRPSILTYNKEKPLTPNRNGIRGSVFTPNKERPNLDERTSSPIINILAPKKKASVFTAIKDRPIIDASNPNNKRASVFFFKKDKIDLEEQDETPMQTEVIASKNTRTSVFTANKEEKTLSPKPDLLVARRTEKLPTQKGSQRYSNLNNNELITKKESDSNKKTSSNALKKTGDDDSIEPQILKKYEIITKQGKLYYLYI